MMARLSSLAAAVLLVAVALPLAQVSAHACSSMTPVAPQDPGDPDTGCNGSSCPCRSAPHDHKNTVPQQSCSKDDEDCTDRRGGCPPRVVDVGVAAARPVVLDVRVACAFVGRLGIVEAAAPLP